MSDPQYFWIFDEDGFVLGLQRIKNEKISFAKVVSGTKLDDLFRDVKGDMTAIVPETYKKEYKKWLKSWTLKQRSEAQAES